MRLFVFFLFLFPIFSGIAHSRSLQQNKIAVPVPVNLKAIAADSAGGYSVKHVIKSSLWSRYSVPKYKEFVPVTAWIVKRGMWGGGGDFFWLQTFKIKKSWAKFHIFLSQ